MSKVRFPEIRAPKPNRPRNAFDLSQRHLFTADCGMLLPVLSLDLLPGDHVELRAKDFMRLLPCNTSSFSGMRGVYEFFFVPYRQLWSAFGQFITGQHDYTNSLSSVFYGNKSPMSVPSLSYGSFVGAFKDLGKDDLGYPAVDGAARLLDLFGYGRITDSKFKPGEIMSTYSCNFFRPAAYQKIYMDYYRNSHYEDFVATDYSLDSLAAGSGLSGNYQANPHASDVAKLFKLRYRNFMTDFSTNIRPKQIFTTDLDISSAGFKSVDFNDDGARVSSLASSQKPFGAYAKSDEILSDFTVSVQSMRQAFALDKLAQVTQRAGKTYRDQMAAHYGIKVPVGSDGKVFYLGGFDSEFSFNDVVQTSASAEGYGYLGDSVSRGIGSGEGFVQCDASEHGVLMCIYSLIPMVAYDSWGIDPMVQKLKRFDFFTPEFENLGLQPLSVSSITRVTHKSGLVIGWQPRYSEYKTARDVNHGSFVGSLRGFTTSRWPQEVLDEVKLPFFKITPYLREGLFKVNYKSSFDGKYDCAFGGCNFQIKKVSNMSVDGLPKIS